MADLQDLPNEVLTEIAQYLSVDLEENGNRSSYALSALSLCSRRFHHISQTLLYRSIVLENDNILNLIKTVLLRPDVAPLIQSMEVYCDQDEYCPLTMQENLKHIVCTQISHICLSNKTVKQWFEDLPGNRMGASLAFLLLLLPNLTDLEINFYSSLDYVYVAMWHSPLTRAEAGLYQQLQFPRLTTLRLIGDSHTEIQFQPILGLDSLRTLCADSLTTRMWNVLPGVSSIHNLEVTDCEMSEDDIVPLLEACNKLRRFTFWWDQPWSDEDVMGTDLDYGIDVAPWIVRGLQQSRTTLEVLDLSGREPIRHDTMSLGNLASFDRLLILRVPAPMVINLDNSSSGRRTLHMLPRSLKHLHLLIDASSRDKALPSEILDSVLCEGWGPALEALTITWHPIMVRKEVPETAMARYQQLQKACDGRSLLLHFKTNKY